MTKPPAAQMLWAPLAQTPYLDRLANRYAIFNAHVSQAICCEPHDDSQRIGGTILGTAAERPRHAESVRELYSISCANGYRTGFGKWHKMPRDLGWIILTCINR